MDVASSVAQGFSPTCYNLYMKLRETNQFSGSQLANALDRFDVRFLLVEGDQDKSDPVCPEDLIAGLACSSEARLRLALIPLFLRQPQLGVLAQAVVKKIPQTAQVTLQCYYCAAYYLQKKYFRQLEKSFGRQTSLPPLFLEQMGLSAEGEVEEALVALAREQQLLTGRLINWRGTYQHAVQRLLSRRECEMA